MYSSYCYNTTVKLITITLLKPELVVVTFLDNNNNLFIYSALFNMLGDQKRITTINNLKTINTNIYLRDVKS